MLFLKTLWVSPAGLNLGSLVPLSSTGSRMARRVKVAFLSCLGFSHCLGRPPQGLTSLSRLAQASFCMWGSEHESRSRKAVCSNDSKTHTVPFLPCAGHSVCKASPECRGGGGLHFLMEKLQNVGPVFSDFIRSAWHSPFALQ